MASARELATYKKSHTWAEVAGHYSISVDKARGLVRRYLAENPAALDNEQGFEVYGEGPNADQIPVEELWQAALTAQTRTFEALQRRRTEQKVVLTPPCVMAYFSDLHFGSPFTDYRAAKRDAEIVRDTPGIVAGFHGDGIDNWIVPKLARLQRQQELNLDGEWQLFLAWLSMLQDKLAYVVCGNHDNWTRAIAGIDPAREFLRGTRILYHPQQVVFDLEVGPQTYRVKVRHRWPYGSIFNTTHSIEVGWERGGVDFDIGIGGDTHRGTYCRPFTRHEKRRYAVLTGTYKLADPHGDEIGAAPPDGVGCGAFVFKQDGSLQWFDWLEEAADYLEFLRR